MPHPLERLSGAGGLPARRAEPYRPRLETLEDRAVPALISGLVLNDAIYSGMAAAPAPVAAAPHASVAPQPAAVSAAVTQVAQEVNFAATRTNASRTGQLPLFDPSLGQLKSVTIQAEGNLTSAVQLENLESTATVMKTELQGSIQYQVGNALLQASPTRTLSATVGAFDGTLDLAGSSAKDFGLTRLDGTFTSVTLTNPSDMAAFVGTGTMKVSQDASVTSCSCGTGNLMALVRSTTQGKVKVVYSYQPRVTPPPSAEISTTPQPSKFFLISGLQW